MTTKLIPTKASCSCCCARPHAIGELDANGRESDYPWYVFRAGLVDGDGEYYSYLCASAPDGTGGCLEEIRREQEKNGTPADRATGLDRQDKANVLAEVLGNDEDGIWAEMND
jgi:hypothetical protein